MPGELENISKKMRELVDGMKQSFQKASASISGHIGEVMSDELKMTSETIKSVGASAKESSMKILKFFGTGWTLELKSFAVDKKQLDVLEDIKKQGEEEKLSRLARFKKSRGGKLLAQLLDLLGIPLAILAAGLGAIIGQILIPFKGIYKILKPFLKLFAGLTKIGKLFTKIAAVGKIAKLIKAFKWLGGLFSFFLKLPGIRIIAAGLKLGFTKLLWPLQILLSVFDFIKGFMETEGSIWEKIKGGISNAVMKFIEFPAKLLGKAIDWLLGREAGTTEGDIMVGVQKYMDWFFNLYDKIFTAIRDAVKWLWEVLGEIDWGAAVAKIGEIREWLRELPNKILETLKEIWNEMLESKVVKIMTPEALREGLRFKGTEEQEARRSEKLEEEKLAAQKATARSNEAIVKNLEEIKKQGGMANVAGDFYQPAPQSPTLPIRSQAEDAAISSLNSGYTEMGQGFVR